MSIHTHLKKIAAALLALLAAPAAFAQVVLIGEYTATDTVTNFVSIASSGTRLTDLEGDDVASQVSLPFMLNFGNERYNQINISSNAQIALGTGNPVRNNYNNNTGTMSIIVPLGHDLDISSTNGNGRVYWKVEGTAPQREVVVEYNRVSPFGSAAYNYYTFQVRLHENGDIDFVYDTCVAAIQRSCYCFVREHSRQSFLACTGTWDNIVVSNTSLTPITTTGTNVPSPGQTIHFSRPQVNCSRPYGLYVDGITTTTACIHWSDSSTTSQWEYEYDVSGFTFGTGTTGTTTADSVLLTGLMPQTSYTIYVHGDCGGQGSMWVPISFMTDCLNISHGDLPYIDKFDDYGTGASEQINPCWTRRYGTNTISYPYASTEQAFSGANSLKFYATRTINSYVILPYAEDSLTTLQLTFRMYGLAANSGLLVGVCDDQDDISTFTLVDSVTVRAANQWDEYEVSFSSYRGNGRHVCITTYNNGTNSQTVYLDNLMLHTIPTCLRPTDFTASNLSHADSVILSWTGGASGATAWDVAYGPAGFDPDTCSTLMQWINDTWVLLDMLQGGVVYDAYVRSVCNDGQSLWLGPLRFVPGSVSMRPATTTGETYSVTLCGGAIYDDGGRDGDYTLPSSYSASTTLTINPEEGSLVTISGTLSCYNSSSYGLYIYDGESTGGRLMGHWYGNATIPRMVSTTGPITIHFVPGSTSTAYSGFELLAGCEPMPPCSPVSEITLTRSPSAAYLSWSLLNYRMGLPASYDVELIDSTGSAQASSTVEPNIYFPGLDINADYLFRVRPMCDDGSEMGWDTLTFRTREPICSQISTTETISVGNGTNTSYYMPVYNYYNYSFTQQLYTAAEMGSTPRDLVGIAFDYAGSTPTRSKNNVRIYMALSAGTSLSSWMPLTSQTLVYTGPLQATNGWNYYMFNENYFHYDGVNSVIVTIEDLSGAYDGSSYTFRTHSESGKALYYYSSSPLTMTNGVPASRYSYSYRNNVKFMICGSHTSCAEPTVVVQHVDATSASLLWLPGYDEGTWDVEYRGAGDPAWNTWATATSAYAATLTSLQPNTRYQVRVGTSCQGTTYTGNATFTTQCIPAALPFTESFEGWSTSGTAAAPSCWQKIYNSTSSSYMPYATTARALTGSYGLYLYTPSGYYAGVVLPVMGASLDSLQIAFSLYRQDSVNLHSVQVGVMRDPTDYSTFRNLYTATAPSCSTWTQFEVPLAGASALGQYIALITPSNGIHRPYIDDIEVDYVRNCPRITTVSATASGDTVYLTWNNTAAASCEIEYGLRGFAHGRGSFAYAYGDSTAVLTGLAPATTYDIYVRTVCGYGDTGRWSGVTTITTPCSDLQLPIDEEFDTWGSGVNAKPMCWYCNTTNGSTNNPDYPSIIRISSNGSYLTSMLYFRIMAVGDRPYAMMPGADISTLPLNQCKVSLDMVDVGTGTDSQFLVVGVSATQGDMSTFTPVDTLTPAAPNNITHHEVSLASYNGYGKYVTFYTYTATTTGSPACHLCIDNVSLQRSTNCGRPDSLYATNVAARTATVGWHDNSYAATWEVEYGPVGGTMNVVQVYSNPAQLTGLDPATPYEFRVRALCTATDTSYWSLHEATFTTNQEPVVLPYSYDFEDPQEWSNWQTMTNCNIDWYRGSATYMSPSHSMYISADGGVSNGTNSGTVNATAYRDIDFGNTDTIVMIRFMTRVGGSLNGNYDGIGIFLEDPATPMTIGTSILMSPWGSLSGNHTCREIIHMDTVWTEHSFYFDSVRGVHRLGFYWFNQSIGTSVTGRFIGTPGAVDNIQIRYVSCAQPSNFTVTTVTENSATATWTAVPGANYILEYEAVGSQPTQVAVSTGSYTITNLQPGTAYRCRLQRDCGVDSSGYTTYCYFTTDYCPQGRNDTVGNLSSTNSSNAYPINLTSQYSFTEMLYLASELSGPANVGQIQFHYLSAKPILSKNNCTIYMSHTRRSSFPSYSSYVSGDSLQMVYRGPLVFVNGWSSIILDTQFVYNGVDNLVIAIDDNSGLQAPSAYQFQITTRSVSMSIQFYGDGYNPDPLSLGTYAGTKTASAIRPNIIIGGCGVPCVAPSLARVQTTHNEARVNWLGSGSAYELCYKASTASDWSTPVTVNDTTYLITGLSEATAYDYRVRQACAGGAYSNWEEGEFTTGYEPCAQPSNVRQFGSTRSSITVTWDRGGREVAWVVSLSNNAYTAIDTSFALMYTFEGLASSTTYNARVKPLCLHGRDTVDGDWTETVPVNTSSCKPVTNLRLAATDATSVTIRFTAGSNNTGRWEVDYGPRGHSAGSGTVVAVTDNEALIPDLTEGAELDIYVRAICAEDYVSTWSEPLAVTVGSLSAVAAEGSAALSLYPNPAQGSTTVSVQGAAEDLTLTLHDINGRTLATYQLPCAAGCEQQLTLDNLAPGTYFVRLKGSTTTQTRKLIIQ
ncbi:MAG: fibronectin type III domain-containing protein [Bacteroidales bacterium]|nr:fibronectin type III domain-containing protein [Bacteroidales bacterium]